MKISVVIPVYNEERYIRECLISVLNGSRKPDELIVCDGGSSDHTVKIAKKMGATVYRNPRRTAAAGRNVGIRHAEGDIIAFTDGDCAVHYHWLEKMEQAFKKYPADAVGGCIKGAKSQNEIENYWNHLQLDVIMKFGEKPLEIRCPDLQHSLITANCAYRRDLLLKLHGFDLWFANNGEDVDLQWRALKSGARIFYTPEAIVDFHGVTSMDGLRRKSFRNGISSSKLQKRYGSGFNHDWSIYTLWVNALFGTFQQKKWARLELAETTWHLLGKYYGSIKSGVINI